MTKIHSSLAASALACAVLFGCAAPGTQTVRWIKTTDKIEASAICERRGAKLKARGCMWRDGSVCVIVAPETWHETIGHELRHCFDGAWHE